jgi:hypothetical protein
MGTNILERVNKIEWELQEQIFKAQDIASSLNKEIKQLSDLSAQIGNLKMDVVNNSDGVEKDSGRKLHYYFIGSVDFHSLLASYLSEKEVKSLSDSFTSVCAREDKTPENFAKYVKVVDKESFLVEPNALFVW